MNDYFEDLGANKIFLDGLGIGEFETNLILWIKKIILNFKKLLIIFKLFKPKVNLNHIKIKLKKTII